ncbi:MAG: formyltetrahydrofolate deformylase, partial [Pseudomonadota bacterium]
MDAAASHVLRFQCPDRVGLVADLARAMAEHGWFIAASRTFGDEDAGQFFARLVIHGDEGGGDLEGLEYALDAIANAESKTASWSIHRERAPIKALIMVSKSDHCA